MRERNPYWVSSVRTMQLEADGRMSQAWYTQTPSPLAFHASRSGAMNSSTRETSFTPNVCHRNVTPRAKSAASFSMTTSCEFEYQDGHSRARTSQAHTTEAGAE